jgi:hypothetical protein
VHLATTMFRAAVVAALAASGSLVAAGSVGAGEVSGAAPLTVVKTLTGTAPAGTTFTATIQCDGPIIDDGAEGTDVATVTFDEIGQPTSADTVYFRGPGGCVVTETADGGAESTTYSCEELIPELPEVSPGGEFGAQQAPPEEGVCEAPGPQDGPMGVGIVYEDQQATVTIHNTYADPVPAAQVVAQPAFTG